MKALAYDRFGDIGVLGLRDLPDPVPGRGDVVVALRATSVNVIDCRVRKGMMGVLAGKTFPKIPGADVAGEVVALGEGVTGLRMGDAVFGATDPFKGGAFAECVALPAAQLALKPPDLSFAQAAVLPIAGLAALIAMQDLGQVSPGRTVLVHGASGGVGLLAVQIAKALGGVVTAVSGSAGLEAVRQAGADVVLDYQARPAPVLAGPFDVILNASGALPFAKGRALLAPSGRLVEPSPTIPVFIGAQLANLVRSQKHLMLQTKASRAGLEHLAGLVAAGRLAPTIAATFPFARATDAIAQSEKGGTIGKIAVTFD